MKKLLSLALCFVMLFVLIPFSTVNVSAENYTDPQGVTYTRSDDGTYYIVTYCNTSVTSVVIPAEIKCVPVKEIGHSAFFDCYNLTIIEIPNSMTSIGDYAFENCSSLISIVIPDSVTTIGHFAFFECNNLIDIYCEVEMQPTGWNSYWLGDCSATVNWGITEDNPAQIYTDYQGVKYTLAENGGYYIVTDCIQSIKSVVFPTEINGVSITEIGDSAFSGCTSLTSIEIPDFVTTIGTNPFSSCSSLEEIIVDYKNEFYYSENNCLIEKSTKTLISGCKNSIIPNSITSIGDYAFNDCSSLTSIVIPDSVTKIGYYAFGYCRNLTSIEIPNSVTTIAYNPFSGCSSLEVITVDIGNEYYYSENNCIIEKSKNTLISGCKNSVIPNFVTTICDSAFSGFTSIISIDIPNSVRIIGEHAFGDCTNLISVEIPDSVTIISYLAFSGCTSLTSIDIPNSVRTIDEHAFTNCTNLISVEIPDSVTTIGYNAFYGCNRLTDIYCQARSQPSGWDSDWIYGCDTTVHWGYVPPSDDTSSNDTSNPEDTSKPNKEEEPVGNMGDLNGNNKIDMTDYILLKRAYFGTYNFTKNQKEVGDINGNKKIDMTDYILVKRMYFGTYAIK